MQEYVHQCYMLFLVRYRINISYFRNIFPLDASLVAPSSRFFFRPSFPPSIDEIRRRLSESRYEIAVAERESILGATRGTTPIVEQEVDWLARSLLLLSRRITFDRISEGLLANVAQVRSPSPTYLRLICNRMRARAICIIRFRSLTSLLKPERATSLPWRNFGISVLKPGFEKYRFN